MNEAIAIHESILRSDLGYEYTRGWYPVIILDDNRQAVLDLVLDRASEQLVLLNEEWAWPVRNLFVFKNPVLATMIKLEFG